ncbi:unnamed protein product [Periconia digitata]|uniref:Fork-head domain-containing protein n=1 Tax=Periconia digitata TaxID=1303443 RepID=A0A9W4XR38_9PLEO|nr:unnamed protein product [Periconia digitata]
MPHAHSPLPSGIADVADSRETVEPSKDPSAVQEPLRSQDPSSSPALAEAPPAMKVPYLHPASVQDPEMPLANFDAHNMMGWECDRYDAMDPVKQEDPDFAPYHPMGAIPEDPAYHHNPQSNAMNYNDNYNIAYSSPFLYNRSYSYNTKYDLAGLSNETSTLYPPNVYHIEPAAMDFSYSSMNGHNFAVRDEFDGFGTAYVHDELADYSSPYHSDVAVRSGTPNGDQPLQHHEYRTNYEDNSNDKEQPYAQLIYRALLDAPGHTMILRDIYEWFKKNTDKAADKETKGWQNSIRHNLSMNGAFEKVDHPCEESRRGFMWRLTDDAIRGGVKSTTRYRSKQPNKRGHRSQNPLPQRQASGSKGGTAARHTARVRKSTRGNDLYSYRSTPRNDQLDGVPSTYEAESPYYNGSPTLSDIDFDYPKDDTAAASAVMDPNQPPTSNFELFSSVPTQAYSPLPQLFTPVMSHYQEPMGHFFHTAVTQDHPSDPLWNTPSPDSDEPRTPESYPGAIWGPDDMGMEPTSCPMGMAVETTYNEFPNGLM